MRVLAVLAAAYAAIMFVPMPTVMAAETAAPLPPVQKLCPDGKIIAYTAKCATAGTVKKVCPYGQVVSYTTPCPTTPPPPPPPPTNTTGKTMKLCPDGSVIGYTAKCATPGTVQKVCPSGQIVAYSLACPAVPPPPPPTNPCWDNIGPVTYSQCPAKTCPGVVNPVPAEQACPPVKAWVDAPLTAGGYAWLKNQGACCNGLIVRLVRWDQSTDADPALRHPIWYVIYQQDTSGNYPIDNPYWRSYQHRLNDTDLQGLKPVL